MAVIKFKPDRFKPDRFKRRGDSPSIFALAIAGATILGCGEQNMQPDVEGAPSVLVQYEGDPLSGVQVSLYEPSGSKTAGQTPLAQAITANDGKAYFVNVPSPEPTQYRIELQSLGNAGWMLDPKVIDRFCKTQTLGPLNQNPAQQLSLPARSVRPLESGRIR